MISIVSLSALLIIHFCYETFGLVIDEDLSRFSDYSQRHTHPAAILSCDFDNHHACEYVIHGWLMAPVNNPKTLCVIPQRRGQLGYRFTQYSSPKPLNLCLHFQFRVNFNDCARPQLLIHLAKSIVWNMQENEKGIDTSWQTAQVSLSILANQSLLVISGCGVCLDNITATADLCSTYLPSIFLLNPPLLLIPISVFILFCFTLALFFSVVCSKQRYTQKYNTVSMKQRSTSDAPESSQPLSPQYSGKFSRQQITFHGDYCATVLPDKVGGRSVQSCSVTPTYGVVVSGKRHSYLLGTNSTELDVLRMSSPTVAPLLHSSLDKFRDSDASPDDEDCSTVLLRSSHVVSPLHPSTSAGFRNSFQMPNYP